MKIKTKIIIGIFLLVLFAVVAVCIQAIYAPPVTESMPAGNPLQLNETFHRSDFAYGPQAWKPYNSKSVPIVSGHDPAGNDSFYVMFIDLNATPFGMVDSDTYHGGINVEYSFKDLTGLAAFHAYGFATKSNALGNTPGIYLTNRVDGMGSSGYYVYGASKLAGTVPSTQMIDCTNVKVNVANDGGAMIDSNGDGTYSILFNKPGGGLNALHITNDLNATSGQVTFTDNQSGVFHITSTGGSGFEDTILMVAVNGIIPDTFELNIKSSYNTEWSL